MMSLAVSSLTSKGIISCLVQANSLTRIKKGCFLFLLKKTAKYFAIILIICNFAVRGSAYCLQMGLPHHDIVGI